MEVPSSSDTNKAKEDITLTNDETKRLEECFRDKEFRDLLGDYVREISNPSTKMAYEQYLEQVEREGGSPQNRKLMKPIAEFCIKAKVIINSEQTDTNIQKRKHIFLNICNGALVANASLRNSSGFDHKLHSSGSKKAGLCWEIPYILGHKRFDANDGSAIYDIAFSSDTIKLLSKDKSFKTFVIQTALEAVNGIQNEYVLDLNKKHKILSTNKHKGNVEPPLMSVFIPSETEQNNKRMIDITEMENRKEIKYKIVESAEGMDIADCWSDNTLLIDANPLGKVKQIYIITKLENVSSISEIDIKMNENILCILIKNNKYKKCEINLKKYNIIESSMSASWFKKKKELKIILKTERKMKIKTERKMKTEINIADDDNDNNDDSSFLLKEIKTKRTVNDDDMKHDLIKMNSNDNTAEVLCHHKLPMILSANTKYWICCKSQNEKCTAFKWDKHVHNTKKVVKQFEIEKREKCDKMVVLIRIRNIIESSVNIQFDINGEILMEFETEENKYYKRIQINHQINVTTSKYDLNSRNLLIMVAKQDIQKDSSLDDILNDSVLFEID